MKLNKKFINLYKGSKIIKINYKDPYYIPKLIDNLINLEIIKNKNSYLSKLILGKFSHLEDILVRQHLTKYYKKYCISILENLGKNRKIRSTLPYTWRVYLKEKNFKVSSFYCKINLFIFSLYQINISLRLFLRILLKKNNFKNFNNDYDLFANDDLSYSNLPSTNKKYNLISWYMNKSENNCNIFIYSNSIKNYNYDKINIVNSLFPKFTKLSQIILFILLFLYQFFITLISIFTGKWWFSILLYESILLNYISLIEKKYLAKKYLFHNSYLFYRPLWTYETELHGSKTVLYFYSANGYGMNFGKLKTPHSYGLKLMRWNLVYVLNDFQKKYLENINDLPKYLVMEGIELSDIDEDIIIDKKYFNIGVFDITPTRPTYYLSIGYALPPYYSVKMFKNFFKDLLLSSQNKKCNLLWKPKRKIPKNFTTKEYYKFQNELSINKNNITLLNAEIASKRIIEKCDAVISMPFSSPSLIAKNLKIPSIYYDASYSVLEDDFNNIDIVKSQKKLEEWINKIYNNYFLQN